MRSEGSLPRRLVLSAISSAALLGAVALLLHSRRASVLEPASRTILFEPRSTEIDLGAGPELGYGRRDAARGDQVSADGRWFKLASSDTWHPAGELGNPSADLRLADIAAVRAILFYIVSVAHATIRALALQEEARQAALAVPGRRRWPRLRQHARETRLARLANGFARSVGRRRGLEHWPRERRAARRAPVSSLAAWRTPRRPAMRTRFRVRHRAQLSSLAGDAGEPGLQHRFGLPCTLHLPCSPRTPFPPLPPLPPPLAPFEMHAWVSRPCARPPAPFPSSHALVFYPCKTDGVKTSRRPSIFTQPPPPRPHTHTRCRRQALSLGSDGSVC